MDLLKVGKIVNTFGIKGELKVVSDSEFIKERFSVNNRLYLSDKSELVISSFRMHKNNILIRVNNLNDINEVEHLKNQDVFVDKDDIEALDDGYYLFELENLDVYEDDVYLGKVIEVSKPHQTIIRVESADREILIPFVDAFIKNVDLENGRIDVELIEGL